jgi:TolB-like protein
MQSLNKLLVGIVGVIAFALDARAQSYDTELASVSEALSAFVKKADRRKITVLDFTDLQGNVTEIGRFLAEELSVGLVERRNGFAIMDRANLKKILEEHKLTQDGLVDPENAKKLGQFAGVDAIVIGNVTVLQDAVALTAKIIATDTAEILGAARGRISKSSEIRELLDRSLINGTQPGKTNDALSKSSPNLGIEKNSHRVGDLLFKVESMKLLPGDQVYGFGSLTLIIANLSSSDTIGVALQHHPRIENQRGDSFESTDISGIINADISPYRVGPYAGDLTDIAPGSSIKVMAKSHVRWTGRAGDYRPYRLQVGILFGKESNGRFSSLRKHNMIIDID